MTELPMNDFPRLREVPLALRVADELRSRIIDGRLRSGTEVGDSAIAAQMNISRGPVREACNLLVEDGLLVKESNAPFRVREWTEDDLVELNLIRWGYEAAAARRLVSTSAPVVGAERALVEMDRAAVTGDLRASMIADMRFHVAFVAATGLPDLITMHRRACERSLMVPIPADLPYAITELQRARHQTLLDALVQSRASADPTAVIRAITEHIHTYRTLQAYADDRSPRG